MPRHHNHQAPSAQYPLVSNACLTIWCHSVLLSPSCRVCRYCYTVRLCCLSARILLGTHFSSVLPLHYSSVSVCTSTDILHDGDQKIQPSSLHYIPRHTDPGRYFLISHFLLPSYVQNSFAFNPECLLFVRHSSLIHACNTLNLVSIQVVFTFPSCADPAIAPNAFCICLWNPCCINHPMFLNAS